MACSLQYFYTSNISYGLRKKAETRSEVSGYPRQAQALYAADNRILCQHGADMLACFRIIGSCEMHCSSGGYTAAQKRSSHVLIQ